MNEDCRHRLGVKQYDKGESLVCKVCNTDLHDPWMDLIVSDSGWEMNEYSSRPMRGIRDYDRAIRFKSPLDQDTLKKVVTHLRDIDCPGWTGVTARDMGEGLLYRFSTTYDSSD